MLDVDAEIDLRDVEAGLTGMANAGRNLSPLLRRWKKPLRDDQRQHAREEEGPSGAWVPLSPWTMAKRLARKGKQGRRRRAHRQGPLFSRKRVLGRLPSAINVISDAHRVAVVSRASWSGVHQDGGTAGRGSRIPARPFLWLSKKVVAYAADQAQRYLLAGWDAIKARLPS